MINNALFDKTLNQINEHSEKYKNALPILLVLPTFVGGLWQILELLFIDPSFIRFFSVTQLISDGILILAIFIILVVYLNFLDRYFKFKDLVNFDLSKKKFNPIQFLLLSLWVLGFIGYYYYYLFHDFGFIHLKISRVGTLLIIFLSIGFFLPIFLKSLLILLHELSFLFFFYSREAKIKHIKEFREKRGKLYFLFRLISTTIAISIICFFIFSLTILIQFRNKIIYPQNLENLENIFDQVHSEYGRKQKSSILYFNDTYVFVELENKKGDDKDPKRIKIYKTDDILFKNED